MADRRHSNEVVGARQKAGEGRGERNLSLTGQAHGRADHVLLGDKVLEEAVGELRPELVGEGRVLHVRIKHHNQRIRFAQPHNSGAECLTSRHRVCEIVVGGHYGCPFALALQFEDERFLSWQWLFRPPNLGGMAIRQERGVQFRERFVRFRTLLKGLAVPVHLVFDERHSLALQGAREDDGGTVLCLRRLVECVQERLDVVPIHWQRVPPEAAPPSAVGLDVVLQEGGIALAETVDIDDRAEVIELKMHCQLGRFPVGALDGFAISHQDIGAGAGMIQALGIQRDPDAGRQALAQRAGGHVHEIQPRSRMAFQVAL